MSMAIWAHYRLADSSVISDETDKHQMLEYMEDLDELCETLNTTPLSSFLDASEAMEIAFDDELDDFDEVDIEEEWYSPRDFIYVIDALYESISSQPEQLNAQARHIQELLEELEQCLNFAQEALEQDSEQFHLTLVM